ncbi:MAG: spore germination protein [Clostridiales bacterium]|nr:spore germination protein [Clostridiales bacterium]
MFLRFLFRKLRFFGSSCLSHKPEGEYHEKQSDECKIKTRLQKSLDSIKDSLGNSCDVKTHTFKFGPEKRFSGAIVFIDGLVSSSTITESILRPIVSWQPIYKLGFSEDELADLVSGELLCAGEVTKVSLLSELTLGCLSGDTAILLDGCPFGLVVSTKGWEKRNVTEPQAETVVRGPREGFTENLRTNTALVRRKLKSENLRVENLIVGRNTQTDICIMYLDGIADPKVIETVKYRISGLDVDSILESGYIEEYIEDAPFSPFATVGYTEKPDVVAARLLEGRVGIVVDGTPIVLTVPMLFIENFQTTEDYYTRPLYASLVRILRFIGYLITVFLPAIYIALINFHQELIPTTLLFTIANAREGTPFPALLEMMIMIFAFEILREAGIRLPRPVGQAISIVGALVMGDAAVSAGLVGAPILITVAITSVAGFLVPAQNDSASLLRLIMMLLASFAGWYGVSMGFLAVLLYIGSLDSFGTSYFDGFAWSTNLQDSIVRMPLWSMVRRPKDIARNNLVRRRFFIPPLRPHSHDDNDDSEREG